LLYSPRHLGGKKSGWTLVPRKFSKEKGGVVQKGVDYGVKGAAAPPGTERRQKSKSAMIIPKHFQGKSREKLAN